MESLDEFATAINEQRYDNTVDRSRVHSVFLVSTCGQTCNSPGSAMRSKSGSSSVSSSSS